MERYRVVIVTYAGQQLYNQTKPFTSAEKARRFAWMQAKRLHGRIGTVQPV